MSGQIPLSRQQQQQRDKQQPVQHQYGQIQRQHPQQKLMRAQQTELERQRQQGQRQQGWISSPELVPLHTTQNTAITITNSSGTGISLPQQQQQQTRGQTQQPWVKVPKNGGQKRTQPIPVHHLQQGQQVMGQWGMTAGMGMVQNVNSHQQLFLSQGSAGTKSSPISVNQQTQFIAGLQNGPSSFSASTFNPSQHLPHSQPQPSLHPAPSPQSPLNPSHIRNLALLLSELQTHIRTLRTHGTSMLHFHARAAARGIRGYRRAFRTPQEKGIDMSTLSQTEKGLFEMGSKMVDILEKLVRRGVEEAEREIKEEEEGEVGEGMEVDVEGEV